jgi:hypothetical protein
MTDPQDELEDHQRSLGLEPAPDIAWWGWLVVAPFAVLSGVALVVLKAVEVGARIVRGRRS